MITFDEVPFFIKTFNLEVILPSATTDTIAKLLN